MRDTGAVVMGGYRVTIAGLAWAVAFAAVWLGAMRSMSMYWTAAAQLIVVGAVLTSILGVCLARGPTRAFWLGFALFVLGFAFEVHNDWGRGSLVGVMDQTTSDLAALILPPLPTEPAELSIPATSAAEARALDVIRAQHSTTLQQRHRAIIIFKYMYSLSFYIFIGFLGGMIAHAIAAARRDEARPGAAA